jgi:hypothetical protein
VAVAVAAQRTVVKITAATQQATAAQGLMSQLLLAAPRCTTVQAVAAVQ